MPNETIPPIGHKIHEHMPEIELLRVGDVITVRYLKSIKPGERLGLSISAQHLFMDPIFHGKTWVLQAERIDVATMGVMIEWQYFTAEASKTIWG